MTKQEITELQLEGIFGTQLPRVIQRLINRELGSGVWFDGYELAVSNSEISSADAAELLETVLSINEASRINPIELKDIVDSELPQSHFTTVNWVTDVSGDYALTDSLRVAKFSRTKPIWRTSRLSYDGIEFDSIEEGKLHGRAWLLGSHESPYAPFVLDFSTGEVLSGHVVE